MAEKLTLQLASLYRNGPHAVRFAENIPLDPLRRDEGLTWAMSFEEWDARHRPITLTVWVDGS